MGPKKAFRLKPVREPVGNSSSQSCSFDERRFVSAEAEDRFNMLVGRQFVSEKKFAIDTHGPYR